MACISCALLLWKQMSTFSEHIFEISRFSPKISYFDQICINEAQGGKCPNPMFYQFLRRNSRAMNLLHTLEYLCNLNVVYKETFTQLNRWMFPLNTISSNFIHRFWNDTFWCNHAMLLKKSGYCEVKQNCI